MNGGKAPVLDDDPRLVELCLNCKSARCYGKCEDYDNLRRAISPFTAKAKYTGKLYELDGRKQTLCQWAHEYGVLERTLRKRVERGMSLREALNREVRPMNHQYVAFGKVQSICEWGKEYGISPSTLTRRMNLGMTLEQALKAPSIRRKNGQKRAESDD